MEETEKDAESIEKMSVDELKKRKNDLKREILTLDWDDKRNQLHFAKKEQLKEYKQELQKIEDKLNEQS